MKIVFRVDSSLQMGTGHLMRCLTLADELHNKGIQIMFICRDLPGNLGEFIKGKGYRVHYLSKPESPPSLSHEVKHAHWLGTTWEQDALETRTALAENRFHADWLIVDHYALEQQWEQYLKNHVKKIMVIDDLADRAHCCDLLLDQNYYRDLKKRYERLIPKNCTTLLGPKYALLRPEFKQIGQQVKLRDGNIRKVLVSFGGSDLTKETQKTLEAFRLINDPQFQIDVVIGATNPNAEALIHSGTQMPNLTVHHNTSDMATLMANADMAIGAGGSTTWERCYLGLPSLVIIIAENQMKATTDLALTGAIINLGDYHTVTSERLAGEVQRLMASPELVKEMSLKAFNLMDHQYGDHPVLQYILEE